LVLKFHKAYLSGCREEETTSLEERRRKGSQKGSRKKGGEKLRTRRNIALTPYSLGRLGNAGGADGHEKTDPVGDGRDKKRRKAYL